MLAFFQNAMFVGEVIVLRHSDATDRAARTRDLKPGDDRLLEADALEHRVRAESTAQLASLASLPRSRTTSVARSSCLKATPRGVVAEQDDLLAHR